MCYLAFLKGQNTRDSIPNHFLIYLVHFTNNIYITLALLRTAC